MNKKILGNQYIIELYDCDVETLKSVTSVEKIMNEAGKIGKFTVVEKCFHQFEPFGVSGVLVLAESHFTIHTWPEYAYASIDIYLCDKNIDIDVVYEYLKKMFNSKSFSKHSIDRGILVQKV